MTRQSVLIIDDDRWLAEEFARTLGASGYMVTHAHDTLEGITSIDKKRPDAIVLDIFMPGPNGIVLLHELQSHSDLATIPVVLCTNAAAEMSRTDMRPYGVVQMLDKSTMEPADLVSAVKKAL